MSGAVATKIRTILTGPDPGEYSGIIYDWMPAANGPCPQPSRGGPEGMPRTLSGYFPVVLPAFRAGNALVRPDQQGATIGSFPLKCNKDVAPHHAQQPTDSGPECEKSDGPRSGRGGRAWKNDPVRSHGSPPPHRASFQAHLYPDPTLSGARRRSARAPQGPGISP